MDIFLSILIYNPIEAFCFLLLCDMITGIKTKIGAWLIPYLYIFGVINIAVQSFPTIWVGEPCFALVNVFVNYFVTPFTLKIFYKCIGNFISYRRSFVAVAIECIFIIVISGVFGLFVKDYDMFYTYNKLHEFITNIVIFSIQIFLYLIIRTKGESYYEKHRKDCS